MSEEIKKEPVKVSVSFKSVDDKPKFKFNPEVSEENFNYHFSNIMNNFVAAYCSMFKNINLLRPATEDERSNHIYVFKTDDESDKEHSLYKARKFLYDQTTAAVSVMLSTVFPDVEYIEACKQYQQEYTFEHTDDKEHLETIEVITKAVRENYDKLLTMLLAAADPEVAKELNKTIEESNFETDMEA